MAFGQAAVRVPHPRQSDAREFDGRLPTAQAASASSPQIH
jgi:hypothetical protein